MQKNLALILLSSSLLLTGLGYGQLTAYQKPVGISSVHTLFEYRKSNWDGTHASTVFLYVADSGRLESFKWTEGDNTATLVTAVMDWDLFSVKSFTNHRLETGKEPMLVASLQADKNGQISIEAGPYRDSMTLAGLPWQSYDFDFAGLGFTWQALRDKKAPFYIHIADAARVNGQMAFVNKGRVDIHYAGQEMLDTVSCYKYAIGGDGLENRGGSIWIDPADWMIKKYMISLPDKPGFENGMLQLVQTRKISPGDWEIFKRSKLR